MYMYVCRNPRTDALTPHRDTGDEQKISEIARKFDAYVTSPTGLYIRIKIIIIFTSNRIF